MHHPEASMGDGTATRFAVSRNASVMSIDYSVPGPLTAVTGAVAEAVSSLDDDPVALCRAAQGLVISPELASAAGIADERQSERNIRPAGELLDLVLQRSDARLDQPRSPEHRVVGTCRHVSVVAVALLRAHGIHARSRCGFASYFSPGRHVDHWVVEHLRGDRWVRIDPEILGFGLVPDAEDLAPSEFLTGGEAWTVCQAGGDPATFGVHGVDHAWGIGEVRGNAIRDLAALNKVEMLPWDEWSRMEASYNGDTGDDFDALISEIAATTSSADSDALARLYASEDLTVPSDVVRW